MSWFVAVYTVAAKVEGLLNNAMETFWLLQHALNCYLAHINLFWFKASKVIQSVLKSSSLLLPSFCSSSKTRVQLNHYPSFCASSSPSKVMILRPCYYAVSLAKTLYFPPAMRSCYQLTGENFKLSVCFLGAFMLQLV